MKNILLAVVGLSPQVVTETLFALHQQGRRVDAIHIITTRSGKDAINTTLFAGGKGIFHKYLEEYEIALSSICFSHENIHVVKDANGIEADDIRDEADNENLLELCLNLAFGLTADPQSAVFFSIAGGRKTMSSCLTLAAQMYGRPQDRIFHVLVSPEFESNRDFFYPPRVSHAIRCIGANREPFYKETCYARVTLVPVPFVSIRESLEPELLNRPSDPATLLASLVREEKPVLTVDLPGCKLTYRNLEMDLSCAHMALYAFFAIQKKDCERPLSCKACTECFLPLPQILEHSQDIERLYRRIAGTRPLVQMSTTGIASLDAENFNSYKSKIKRSLQKSFGQHAMQELEIASSGSRPDTCYGLPLQKERIRIVF